MSMLITNRGNNRFNIKLDNDTIITNPNEYMYKFYNLGQTEEHENFTDDYWRLRTIWLLGSPESGKSVLIHWLAKFLYDLWGKDNVQVFSTRNLGYAMWNAPIKKKVVLIFVDDAVKILSGRNSMKKKQKKDTADFLEVRHILGEYREDTPKGGIVFMAFASQTIAGIDKRIRENYDMLFLKTANYKRWMEKKFDESLIDNLRKANRKAYYEYNDDYKGFFLGHSSKTDDQFYFYTPYMKIKDIIEVNPELEDLSELKQDMKDRFYIPKLDRSFLKGYAFKWARKRNIDISSSEINQVIYEAIFEQISEREIENKNEKEEKELNEEAIIDSLIEEFDIKEADKDIIKAYIELKAEEQGYDISIAETNKLIRKAKYIVYTSLDYEENEILTLPTLPYRKIHELRILGTTYEEILTILSLQTSRPTLAKYYEIWCLYNDLTPVRDTRKLTNTQKRKRKEIKAR